MRCSDVYCLFNVVVRANAPVLLYNIVQVS